MPIRDRGGVEALAVVADPERHVKSELALLASKLGRRPATGQAGA